MTSNHPTPSGDASTMTDDRYWVPLTDPAMYARVQAAVSRIFRHFEATNPGTIRREKAQDGSDLAYLWYDRAGDGTAGWDLFEGVGPEKSSPFRRADFTRTRDGKTASIAADSDGCTVLFGTRIDGTVEELLDALESFAQMIGAA